LPDQAQSSPAHERWLERVWPPPARDLTLDQLYRALDILAEHGDAIEQEVWHCVDLFDKSTTAFRLGWLFASMRPV
jgi:hypothetical protein